MQIQLYIVSLLLATDTLANSLKIYTPNHAGGHIVLTQENCQLEKFKERYPYRGYATTSNPDELYEGCYVVPSIAEAPEMPPGYTIIPLVNYVDQDGITLEYPLEIFSSTPEEPDIGPTI